MKTIATFLCHPGSDSAFRRGNFHPGLVILGATALIFGVLGGRLALANPEGANVVHGNISLSGLGTSALTVNQGSNLAIINWQDFSIGAGEITHFVQPGLSSLAINRVVGGNLSAIYGQLRANGSVMVINPQGIIVGPSGVIDVRGALTLSTLDASNQALINGYSSGSLRLSAGSTGISRAAIRNLGSISAGDVTIVSQIIENQGKIDAARNLTFGAGDDMIVSRTQEGSTISIQAGAGSIENTGSLTGGNVDLGANGNPYGLAINTSGLVKARGWDVQGGRLKLSGGAGRVVNSGDLSARQGNGAGGQIDISAGDFASTSGRIDATGAEGMKGGNVAVRANNAVIGSDSVVIADGAAGGNISIVGSQSATVAGTLSSQGTAGKGGKIDVTGQSLAMTATSRTDVSGLLGGGDIRVGGGYQGKDTDIMNAGSTRVERGSLIIADGRVAGDGGKVIVWADRDTMFNGEISAQALGVIGNGGFVEVSGKSALSFDGYARTMAAAGQAGTLLLDPTDVTIGPAGTGGITMTDAALLSAILQNNVVIHTGGNGGGSGNIVILPDSDVQYDSPNSLSLFAHQHIFVDGDIKNHGTSDTAFAGTGNITLVAGWNGVGTFGTGNISAANIRAGTYGTYGNNSGSVFLNSAAAEPVEVGSARGETNAFGDLFLLTAGDNGGEFTQFGYRRENDIRAYAIAGLGVDGMIGTLDDVLIRTGFDLDFDEGVTGDINVYANNGVFLLQHPNASVDRGVKDVDRTYVMIGHGGQRENDNDVEARNNVANLALGFTGAVAADLNAVERTADFGSDSGNATVGNGDNHGNITINTGGVLIVQAGSPEGFAQIGHGGSGHDDPDHNGGQFAVSDRNRHGDNAVQSVHLFGNMTGDITVTASAVDLEGGRFSDAPVMIGHGGQNVRGNHFGTIEITTTSGGIRGRAAPDSNTGASLTNANDGAWDNNRDRSFIQIGHGGLDSDFLFLDTLGGYNPSMVGRVAPNALDAYDTIGAVARPDDPIAGIFMDARPGRDVNVPAAATPTTPRTVFTSRPGDGIAINRVRGTYSDNPATTVNGVAGGVTNTSFGHRGDITINSAGDLTMMAGNGSETWAMIGHGGRLTSGDHFGNISINAVGNMLFSREAWQVNVMGQDISNRGTNSHVQIGHGGSQVMGGATGNINVVAGGSIEFYGGRGESYAMIGHGGTGNTGTSTDNTRGQEFASGTHSGNITVDAGRGIKFRSGFGVSNRAFSQIGHGGYFQYADVTQASAGYALFGGGAPNALNEGHNGSITVTARGGNIDFNAGPTDLLTGQNWLERTANESYTMIGHGGDRSRGDHSGLVNVTATGDLTMVARGGWHAIGVEDTGAVNNSDDGSGAPRMNGENGDDNSVSGIRNFTQLGHGGFDADHQNLSAPSYHRDNTGKHGDGIGVQSLSNITLNIGGNVTMLAPQQETAQLPIVAELGNGTGTLASGAQNFYVKALGRFRGQLSNSGGATRYVRIRDINAGSDSIGTAHATPITLVFDGTQSVGTVVNAWNAANPNDQIVADDGTGTTNFVPVAQTIQLVGEDVTRVNLGPNNPGGQYFAAFGGRLETVIRERELSITGTHEIWKMPDPVQYVSSSWAQIGNGGQATDYNGVTTSFPGGTTLPLTLAAANPIQGKGHRGDILINAGGNIRVVASDIKPGVATGQVATIQVISGYNRANGDAAGLATTGTIGGTGTHLVGPAIGADGVAATDFINDDNEQNDGTSGVRGYAMIGLGGVEARGDHSGLITINGGGNLDLIAGEGNRSFAQIGSGGADADRLNSDAQRKGDIGQNATININIAGALNMRGGGLQNGDTTGAVAGITPATALDTADTEASYVQIGSGGWVTGGSHSGNITILAGTGVTVESGNSRQAYAQIGNGGWSARSETVTGNVSVISKLGDISLLGATPVVDSLDTNGPANAGNIASARESYLMIGNGGFDADGQTFSLIDPLAQDNGRGVGSYSGNIDVVAAKGKVRLMGGGSATLNADNDRYRSLSIQIGNGGAFTDGDAFGNIRVAAGTDLEINGGKATRLSYSLIGHGGNNTDAATNVGGNYSGTIDIEVGNDLLMQRGPTLDAAGVAVRDAFAKIGHSATIFQGTYNDGSGTRSGDIFVSVGRNASLLNGVNPGGVATAFGPQIGHLDLTPGRTNDLAFGQLGNTFIGVSRTNPYAPNATVTPNLPGGTGTLTTQSGAVFSSTDGGLLTELRFYMPTATQDQIATGASMNGTAYSRTTLGGVGNRLGTDEMVGTDHTLGTGATYGDPTGAFVPEGTFNRNSLGLYTVFFAEPQQPVVGPPPPPPPPGPGTSYPYPILADENGKLSYAVPEKFESFDWPGQLLKLYYRGADEPFSIVGFDDAIDGPGFYVPRFGAEELLDAALGPRNGVSVLPGGPSLTFDQVSDSLTLSPSDAAREAMEDRERVEDRAKRPFWKSNRVFYLYNPGTGYYSSFRVFGNPTSDVPRFNVIP